LDRAIGQHEWSQLYPHALVEHLVTSRSDHCALLVWLKKKNVQRKVRPIKRYGIMWEREASLEEEIKCAWTNHKWSLELESSKLNATMSTLQTWSRENFCRVDKEINTLKKRLEFLMLQNNTCGNLEINSINARLDELLYREEVIWPQRSRISWLWESDKKH
jgi:hypothetical protein